SIPGLGEAAVSLLGVRERLIDEIRRLDRKLKAISAASPATQALMTIPGVGVQTSAAFAAAVDDDEPVQAFANSRRVLRLGPAPAPVGRAGLDRTHYQAGRQYGSQAALRGGQLDPDAHAQDLRAEELVAQDRARPPPRRHHACHAARRHFVRGMR